MDKYIIINSETIQKMIEKTKNDVDDFYGQRKILNQILSQSTPLIPEIEKAFIAGSNWGFASGAEISSNSTNIKQYISNLKLDI